MVGLPALLGITELGSNLMSSLVASAPCGSQAASECLSLPQTVLGQQEQIKGCSHRASNIQYRLEIYQKATIP